MFVAVVVVVVMSSYSMLFRIPPSAWQPRSLVFPSHPHQQGNIRRFIPCFQETIFWLLYSQFETRPRKLNELSVELATGVYKENSDSLRGNML